MSKDIYGYVATRDPEKAKACLEVAARSRNIGLAMV
jgi:hypothetical protein